MSALSRLILVSGLAFALAGCVTTETTTALVPQPEAEPETAVTPKAESEAPLDGNDPIARLKGTSTNALLGMERNELAALLGYPRFVREESIARVWQYSAGECVLDLFLYPTLDQPAEYEVVHVEARHRKVIASVSLQDCFGGLVQARVSADGMG